MQIQQLGNTTEINLRTADRVRAHSPAHINERIDRQSRMTVYDTIGRGRDAVIARLGEIDREWDIDRALMANFAIASGVTSWLGERHRPFKILLRVQQAFLLWHAVVGWCPPVSVLRRLGFRTWQEIAAERRVLIDHLEATPST
jgi:hypothetical protein